MSSVPEPRPDEPEIPATDPSPTENGAQAPSELVDPSLPVEPWLRSGSPPVVPSPSAHYPQEPPLFEQFAWRPEPAQERVPHMGHVAILSLLALICLFSAALVARAGVYYHLFGVSTITQAATEIHYTLGTEGLFYFFTFAGSLLIFPFVWHKGLFTGLQWRAGTAARYANYLVGAAVVCFVLAVIDGVVLPGPQNAPIDKIFREPGAAWILFGFGITLAPFFEEMAFRGFLLPALCTAFDWIGEKSSGRRPRPIDAFGHPNWSMQAMIVASALTSVLFAFLHADQTGYSLGPFLLLVCVSLVLSAVRLALRSLAASVLVHASYNFLLFSLMFLGTGGFRHLENM